MRFFSLHCQLAHNSGKRIGSMLQPAMVCGGNSKLLTPKRSNDLLNWRPRLTSHTLQSEKKSMEINTIPVHQSRNDVKILLHDGHHPTLTLPVKCSPDIIPPKNEMIFLNAFRFVRVSLCIRPQHMTISWEMDSSFVHQIYTPFGVTFRSESLTLGILATSHHKILRLLG